MNTNEDKRRELRILAEQLADYSLNLLTHIYRQLRILDELEQVSDFTKDLKMMTETIGILYSLNQAMYVDKNQRDEVEHLLQQVVPLVGRINLLERTMDADEELRQLHANIQPRVNSLVQEIQSLHEMFGESMGRILARERASVENISEEDGFKRDAERWK
jgi:nitrate/nitrite-specific signal transduction histidine kinase